MNKFFLSGFCLVPLLLMGCASMLPIRELPADKSSRVFAYEYSMPKDEIQTKAMNYVNTYFKSSKAVVQTSGTSSLAGNYYFGVKLEPADNPSGFIGPDPVNCEMTFILNFSDNKLKGRLVVKNLYWYNPAEIPFDENRWGNYQQDIVKEMDTFQNDLDKYLKDPNSF